MERIVEQATVESRELGVEYQGGEHVLLALLRDETSRPAQVLARHGLGFADMQATIRRLRESQA